jgi:mitotic spindle assembly checkpoint protein MAD2B
VCAWINDAIAAIHSQLAKSTVDKVQLCIYETAQNRVLERWTFDLHTLPRIPIKDQDIPFDLDTTLSKPLNVTDLEATFRATLSRISSTASRLKPLPTADGGPACSFTLAIALRPNADRPVGRIDKHERAWIVAEPDSFSTTSSSTDSPTPMAKPTGRPEDDGATTPVRRLEAGELRMEVWVEESAAKFGFETPSHRTAEQRAKEMSYGAGTEKFEVLGFDPERGYEDVEGTDVNKKPDGGRGGWPVG